MGACPTLAFAADQLLQGLCAKWSGNHEAMFAFARQVSAAAPAGDPRHRLVAAAHLERMMVFPACDDRDAYLADEDIMVEVVQAAQRSVLSRAFGSTAQHRLTRNWFAVTIGMLRRSDLTKPLLEAIGDRPAHAPWHYFRGAAPRMLERFRAAADLPPLAESGR